MAPLFSMSLAAKSPPILAEDVLDKLADHMEMPLKWTAGKALPGGDFPVDGVSALVNDLIANYNFLDRNWALRLVRAYGSEAQTLLGDARTAEDLGKHFGATLTETEVRWQMSREFAVTAEDVVWRRTKLGLRMSATEIDALDRWMSKANERTAA